MEQPFERTRQLTDLILAVASRERRRKRQKRQKPNVTRAQIKNRSGADDAFSSVRRVFQVYICFVIFIEKHILLVLLLLFFLLKYCVSLYFSFIILTKRHFVLLLTMNWMNYMTVFMSQLNYWHLEHHLQS